MRWGARRATGGRRFMRTTISANCDFGEPRSRQTGLVYGTGKSASRRKSASRATPATRRRDAPRRHETGYKPRRGTALTTPMRGLTIASPHAKMRPPQAAEFVRPDALSTGPSGVEKHGAVAQLGERCVRNAEVEGSTPFRSTRKGLVATHCATRPFSLRRDTVPFRHLF